MTANEAHDMKRFNVSPFSFPNSPAGEVRFEETRDVEIVEVVFEGAPPDMARLQYLRKTWPGDRIERLGDMDQARPSLFGWMGMDDQFTPEWADAATEATPIGPQTLRFAFKPLRTEMPDFPDAERYDVAFRRTLAVRVVGSEFPPRAVRVFTRSQPARSALRVELHAGVRTPGEAVEVSGYNAAVKRIAAGPGTSLDGQAIRIGAAQPARFDLDVEHMVPAHRYAHDDGHLLFTIGQEAFTISLTALEAEGPIWFAEAGVYIARADDPESFEQYRARIRDCKTIAARVSELPEQSLAGAMNGQPRAHPIPFCFGAKHTRQKFWLWHFGHALGRLVRGALPKRALQSAHSNVRIPRITTGPPLNNSIFE